MQPHPAWWPFYVFLSLKFLMYRKLVHHFIVLFNMSLYYWNVLGLMPITDSLYCCIVWLIAIVIIETPVHSLYYSACICHCIIDMSLGLHAHLTVWFGYVLLGTIAHLLLHCIIIENHVKMCGQRGLKVPPLSQSLHCIILYYWIDVPLFHSDCLICRSVSVPSSQSLNCVTLYYWMVCKDQLAQECCQAYGKGVSWYYPTWFKSHWII